MRYCNHISGDKKSYFPFSSNDLDDKRKKFNEEIKESPNNKIIYFTALCRFLNNSYLTTIRNPKENGMTVSKTELAIKEFIDNFDFEAEADNN